VIDQSPRDEEENANHERWLVSFADFITLMFALFTILFATSNRDLEKTKEFQNSIKRFLIKAGAFGGSGDKISQGEKYSSPIESPIETFQRGSPLSKETFDEAEKFIDEQLTETDRKKYILDTTLDELGVRIVLSGRAIFADGTVKFRPESVSFLERLGDLLSQIGRRVIVEGHVSRAKLANPIFPSEWEFAGARSTAMVRYLVKRHKMDPNLFVPISYGSAHPNSEDSRGAADRLEVVILTEDLPF